MMTVFEDEGRFRLYYTGHYGGTNPEDEYDPRRHVLAYAESDDGVTWTKPSVGSVEFEGSKDNNIVFDDIGTVFKDPSAPADERYKLIYQYKKEGGDRVLGAVSPDGLRWTRLEQPLLTGYVSDTQIVAKFDEEQGKYIGYFRGWDRHEHGRYHGPAHTSPSPRRRLSGAGRHLGRSSRRTSRMGPTSTSTRTPTAPGRAAPTRT